MVECLNQGDLRINNSAVVDNAILAQSGTPAFGGGIYSDGRLDLFDTTVSGNEAVSDGTDSTRRNVRHNDRDGRERETTTRAHSAHQR